MGTLDFPASCLSNQYTSWLCDVYEGGGRAAVSGWSRLTSEELLGLWKRVVLRVVAGTGSVEAALTQPSG